MVRSTKKTTNKKLTRYQKRLAEFKDASDRSNVMEEHVEPPSENMDVGNASQPIACTALQIDENPETAVEVDRAIADDAKQVSKKRTRGPTKVKRLPSNVASRIEVEFNSSGVPVGEGSVKLSSYLGPLVREHVSFTLDDWRLLGDDLKVVLWKSVQDKENCGGENVSQTSKHNEIGDGCSLLNWHGNDDEVIAEGKIVPTDPNNLLNGVPLGPNAKKILVVHPKKSDVFLWRPSPGMVYIGDAKNEKIAWPADRVVIRIKENSEKENESKTNSTKNKCKLFDWGGTEVLVAEGRVHSSDSNQIINGVPLGPEAAIVWVDNPIKEDAFSWRPIAGVTCIGEAVGKTISWPSSKLVFENTIPSTPMSNVPTSRTSANYAMNNKCKLFAVEGTGKIVAEGTISSTNPNDLVHSIPLGPNAIRVWVDIVKDPNASLWRPTSFMECLSDAIGSTVAWPTANVSVDSTSAV